MSKRSAQDIRIIAHNAGFRGEDEITATAIALAESGGDDQVVSKPNTNGTKDYGLFQINSSHFGKLKLDNGVFGVGASYTNAGNMLIPELNAQAAYILYKGRGGTFGDWTTYNNGTYKTFLPQVTGETITPKVTGNIPQDVKNSATENIMGPLLTWLGNVVPAVGFSALAAILFILGVAILLSRSKTAKTVGKAALKVVP